MVAWGLVWLRLAGVDLAQPRHHLGGHHRRGRLLDAGHARQHPRAAWCSSSTSRSASATGSRWTSRAGGWWRSAGATPPWRTRNRETVVIPNGWLMKNRFTRDRLARRASPLWRRWLWFDVDLTCPPIRGVRGRSERAVTRCRHPQRGDRPAAHRRPDGGRARAIGRYALRYCLDRPAAGRRHRLRRALRTSWPRCAPARQPDRARPTRSALCIQDKQRARARRGGTRATSPGAGRARQRGPLRHALGAERGALAEHLVHAPFAKGDTITRQGAVAHWLYLIVSGEGDVWIESVGQRSPRRDPAPGQRVRRDGPA